MSNDFAQQLDALRQAAVNEGTPALLERGFRLNDDGAWHGTLDLGEFGVIAARVLLPERFPDALPEVIIDPKTLARRVPHIEHSGRVCIAPRTGILIDATQPSGLIESALGLATQTLINGLQGSNATDFDDELDAYWISADTMSAWSICDSDGAARSVTCVWLGSTNKQKAIHFLFADNQASARIWANKTGWTISHKQDAFFLPLVSAFAPPGPSQPLLFADVRAIAQQHATEESFQALTKWLQKATLPIAILLAVPLRPPQGAALVGVRIRSVGGTAAQQAQRGFRKSHVPAARLDVPA